MTTPAAGPLHQDEPRVLGPYRLLGRLGRGGMGTVYLAAEPTGRRVAVKVVNRELAGETAFLDRFRREVTAARQVHRFCTAPLIDADLDADPPYIVTEYIDGPSLEQTVAERGPLPGSDLEGLAVGVATALAAIHGAGIVHRDLKPANVLLSPTGPRVIDFGIARALDAADGPTRTGQFIGTPAYIAPEILHGEPVCQASDVFSWGCVVAYAGTGRPPFQGGTVAEVFKRISGDPPVLDGLDPGLRALVALTLGKDPRNRPTAQGLLARLLGQEKADPERAAARVTATWHRPGTVPADQGTGTGTGTGTGGAASAAVPPTGPASTAPGAEAPGGGPVPATAPPGSVPAVPERQTVQVNLPYPEAWRGPKRWFTLVRGLMALPHLVVMLVLSVLLVVVMVLSWPIIPFTGHYPRSLFRFVVGFQRWSGRVVAYAFMLTDEKIPPFRTLPRALRSR
ncbi:MULTISPECIES: DUF4389 domain-containing protein [Thermomonosporaceae]|uniref:DUF4389 domain-containing protein n=1 Tax=Thermomonosporaceae TaxID=2012 RepID=UPI00255A9A34|nr:MULTISPECIES: DUF4389 domain-containing protein [Thermomonosporaceae]MDL4777477.1 DUF4389 domain-containing protein [Actinomadura xylanilytica]